MNFIFSSFQNNYVDTSSLTKEWPSAPIVNVKDVLKKEEPRLNLQEIIFSAGDNSITKNGTDLEFKLLRDEIAELKNIILLQQKKSCIKLEDVESVFKRNMDTYNSMIKGMVHDLLELKQSKERQFHEELKTKIVRDLSGVVKESLGGNVNVEMKERVLPLVVKGFESLYAKLHEEFRSKLSVCDQMVMESLNRLLVNRVRIL